MDPFRVMKAHRIFIFFGTRKPTLTYNLPDFRQVILRFLNDFINGALRITASSPEIFNDALSVDAVELIVASPFCACSNSSGSIPSASAKSIPIFYCIVLYCIVFSYVCII